ncbi:hypothetical protein MJD09_05985 [bacterium]|nr:hypothetical protein [bacterium]
MVLVQKTSNAIIVAKRVLRFLQSNPGAKETLDGIAEWWLMQERITEAVNQVSEAVAWLVAKGYLERKNSGTRAIYKINPSKRSEIARLLREK